MMVADRDSRDQSQPGAAEPLDAARGVVYKHRSDDRHAGLAGQHFTHLASSRE